MVIGDIYAGKPDANDEIRERGYDEFASNYIKPTGVNIDRLSSTKYGTPFFIMGDKGTGKTALLHYLENHVKDLDASACSSFVYFESDYTLVQRVKFDAITHSISSAVAIDNSIATEGNNVECDYTYIWKWQLYQKIISDNEAFNGGLFIQDEFWERFVSELGKITKTIDKQRMRIPAKISFTMTANPQLGTIAPGMEISPVDLSQRSFNTSFEYREFANIIDNADALIQEITRTDIPYYVFIDELEAYRGENDMYYRDLRMIRDLLFTVKRMNDIFRSGTKFLCSVRLEVINAINRYVQPNQLHKIMQGYDERLIWEHTNTNSFRHPIIDVLIRRIQIAEEKQRGVAIDKEEIIKHWFPSNVYNKHVCSYILENTWHKPRDIIRLLLSAQSKNSRKLSSFNQNAFETFMPVYSKQCLVEIKEEMRALYTAEEIEQIFSCIQGYKATFSYDDIVSRAKRLYPDSVFSRDPYTVLKDMYRIGVIGNLSPNHRSPRWEYKEQYGLYIDSPWRIIVHPSLRIELSLSGRANTVKLFTNTEKNGRLPAENREYERCTATVDYIGYSCLFVEFKKNGKTERGVIEISQFHGRTAEAGKLDNAFLLGESFSVEILEFDKNTLHWNLRMV